MFLRVGSSADITFDARGMTTPITLNQTGDTDLSGFTATSIIGALNELQAAVSAAGDLQNTYTAGENLAAGEPVYISAANTVSRKSASTDAAAARFIGVAESAITSASSGEITTEGLATSAFVASLTLNAGDEVFLSTTTGRFTNVAPSGSGNVVLSVGFVKDASAYGGTDGDTAIVQLVRGQKLVV